MQMAESYDLKSPKRIWEGSCRCLSSVVPGDPLPPLSPHLTSRKSRGSGRQAAPTRAESPEGPFRLWGPEPVTYLMTPIGASVQWQSPRPQAPGQVMRKRREGSEWTLGLGLGPQGSGSLLCSPISWGVPSTQGLAWGGPSRCPSSALPTPLCPAPGK